MAAAKDRDTGDGCSTSPCVARVKMWADESGTLSETLDEGRAPRFHRAFPGLYNSIFRVRHFAVLPKEERVRKGACSIGFAKPRGPALLR